MSVRDVNDYFRPGAVNSAQDAWRYSTDTPRWGRPWQPARREDTATLGHSDFRVPHKLAGPRQ